jgi:hypothetical protein
MERPSNILVDDDASAESVQFVIVNSQVTLLSIVFVVDQRHGGVPPFSLSVDVAETYENEETVSKEIDDEDECEQKNVGRPPALCKLQPISLLVVLVAD